eukprot:SAG31_NODE_2288_length_6003_cov_1.876355_2_plen_167_part_00
MHTKFNSERPPRPIARPRSYTHVWPRRCAAAESMAPGQQHLPKPRPACKERRIAPRSTASGTASSLPTAPPHAVVDAAVRCNREGLAQLDSARCRAATIGLLRSVGGIPSPSGGETARAEAVANCMREIALLSDVRVTAAPNAIGRIAGSGALLPRTTQFGTPAAL